MKEKFWEGGEREIPDSGLILLQDWNIVTFYIESEQVQESKMCA